MGDQVVSSSQSFAISLYVTRTVGLAGVGAFAVAFSAYQLLMAVTRPINTDPLAVGFAAADRASQRPAAAAASGGAVLLGLGASFFCGAVSLALEGTTEHVLLAFAVSIPALLLQDACRCVLLTEGRPGSVFINDTLVLVALGGASFAAGRISPGSAPALVLAWGGATALGAVVGSFQAKVVPALGRACHWWRATLHLGGRMLGENLVSHLALNACLLAVALGAGISQLGRLRTAQVALGGATPALIAVSTIVAVEGTRLLASAPVRFPPFIWLASGCAVGLASVLTVFWRLAPLDLGRGIIGPGWESARPLVLPCGAYLAALGASIATCGALRVLRRPGSGLRARAIAAPVTVVLGVAGSFYGPGPAMAGIAAGEWLCAVLTGMAYRSAWRSWQREPWGVAPPAIMGTDLGAPV